jgi:hypothetical protein
MGYWRSTANPRGRFAEHDIAFLQEAANIPRMFRIGAVSSTFTLACGAALVAVPLIVEVALHLVRWSKCRHAAHPRYESSSWQLATRR